MKLKWRNGCKQPSRQIALSTIVRRLYSMIGRKVKINWALRTKSKHWQRPCYCEMLNRLWQSGSWAAGAAAMSFVMYLIDQYVQAIRAQKVKKGWADSDEKDPKIPVFVG